MTVKELMKQLKTMPANATVCYEYYNEVLKETFYCPIHKATKGVNEFDGIVMLNDSEEE